MSTRKLLIIFFLLNTLVIPSCSGDFMTKNLSAGIAMMGSSSLLALLIWSNRAFLINIILVIYVFRGYLLRPYISIFENKLSPQSLKYLESIIGYYNPEAAAVVYWNLFSLLFAWFLGLILIRSPKRNNVFTLPKLFLRIDQNVKFGGLPFWGSFLLLMALSYQDPTKGLSLATVGGDGGGLFLWGLSSLTIITYICLFEFLKKQSTGLALKRIDYLLLLPAFLEITQGAISGSRSSLFKYLIVGVAFGLYLYRQKIWKILAMVKASVIATLFFGLAIVLGLFSQALRPLFKNQVGISLDAILEVVNWDTVIRNKELFYFGISELLYRLADLKAPFMILNNLYVHEPFQYYNPLATSMRIINDLIPGTVFPNVRSINQLFEFIYEGRDVFYNSETWHIQGTLYIYFGHFFAPIIVLLFAIITAYLYPTLEKYFKLSAAFSAFVILLLFDLFENGTAERIVAVDIVRPVMSILIFSLVFKGFNIIFPKKPGSTSTL